MNCIFLCRIWKIENIQTVKTVPCSLFPVPCSLPSQTTFSASPKYLINLFSVVGKIPYEVIYKIVYV
ncbi:MAG: hypothetical protein ACK5S7_05415 [Dolichospermum sp.]